MKRRRLIFCCVLVLVAAGVVALWLRHPKDPVYQGKKLSEWVAQVNHDTNEQAIQEASAAIHAIGAEALPWLMNQFATRNWKLAARVSEWTEQRTGLDLGFDEDEFRYQRAAYGISLLGTNAAPALPVLARYLRDPVRGRGAILAMTGCGEITLPYLLEACASTNLELTLLGVRGLTLNALETKAALPPLVQMTRHTNSVIRVMAILGLKRARPRLDLAIPALTNALSDSDSLVQMKAAFVLGTFGQDAKSAVPALLLMMQSPDQMRVTYASNALHQIDPSALPR